MGTFFEYLSCPRRTRVLCEGVKDLSPTDIYDFYFLCSGLSYDQIYPEDHNIAEFYLREIKDNYLQTFGRILSDQIKKYYSRKRVDPGFDISQLNPNNFEGLKKLMSYTFRSDMKRRNDVWNTIADHVATLSRVTDSSSICSVIDRINNSVHNTQELVLDKLGPAFLQAYDTVHHSKTPKDFVKFVSPEVRRLMKIWRGPGR